MKFLLIAGLMAILSSCAPTVVTAPPVLSTADVWIGDVDGPSPRIEALILADTTDHVNIKDKISLGVEWNAANTEELLKTVSRSTGIPLHIRKIYGDQWSCHNINEAIGDMPLRKGDIAFVYYAGHGYGDADQIKARQHDNMPYIFCGDYGSPPIFPPNEEEIAQKMEAKSPRLAIIIADACNTYELQPSEVIGGVSAGVSLGRTDRRWDGLFLQPSGLVLMASAKRGEHAWYFYDGGAFTNKMLRTYDASPRSRSLTWEGIKAVLTGQPIPVVTKDGPTTQSPLVDVFPNPTQFTSLVPLR
jgi:hypothetical protein